MESAAFSGLPPLGNPDELGRPDANISRAPRVLRMDRLTVWRARDHRNTFARAQVPARLCRVCSSRWPCLVDGGVRARVPRRARALVSDLRRDAHLPG